MRFRLSAVAVLATLLLTACSGPQPAASPAPDLAQLRETYRVPACVDTDPDAEAVPDGLPRTDLACLGTDQRVNLAGLPRTPTIINVWAQWCAPCRQEAPFLRAAVAELDGVAFLGINYNDPRPDWALEFAGLAEWGYPHVQDQDKTLQTGLGIPGIPTTIFVDADGRIAGVHPGVFEAEAQLFEAAETYLGVTR